MLRSMRIWVVALLVIAGAQCSIAQQGQDDMQIPVLAEYPPTGPVLQIDGMQVHAHVEGSGPDLVLIHGAGGNTREWTFSMVDRLKDRYRVVAFDRPGHGYTSRIEAREGRGESPSEQADLLVKAARELGLEQPIVLGQSFGAAVALAWALEHPDMISALVNVSGVSNPWPGGLDSWYRLTNTFFGRTIVIPLASAFVSDGYIKNSVNSIFSPDPVPDGYIDHIGVPLSIRTLTLHANTQQINGLRPHVVKMAERYGEVQIPVEIIHGDADTTVPLDIHSIPLNDQIAGANLTILPGIGHMPQHASEDEVVAAIDRAANRAGLR